MPDLDQRALVRGQFGSGAGEQFVSYGVEAVGGGQRVGRCGAGEPAYAGRGGGLLPQSTRAFAASAATVTRRARGSRSSVPNRTVPRAREGTAASVRRPRVPPPVCRDGPAQRGGQRRAATSSGVPCSLSSAASAAAARTQSGSRIDWCTAQPGGDRGAVAAERQSRTTVRPRSEGTSPRTSAASAPTVSTLPRLIVVVAQQRVQQRLQAAPLGEPPGVLSRQAGSSRDASSW